jgi:hypothetical protein
MENRIIFFWLAMFVFVICHAEGQENNPRATMDIVRVSDFEITGNGSAPEWNTAVWEKIPQRSNYKVGYQTHAKVVWVEVVTGWTAEFFIPWKLMGPLIMTAPLPGTQWRANIYRLDYNEVPTRFSWNPTVRNFHEPHNFGTFIFK